MNKFIIKLSFFVIPLLLIIFFFIYIDTFKLFGTYDSYYKDNIVTLNRGLVTERTYTNNREKTKYNSFIFGSSLSLAFKCQEWEKYLSPRDALFHFDGSGDGVYSVLKKAQYIDEFGDSIKNALIIVDREFLRSTANGEGHIYILTPEISKESKLKFYLTFLKAQIFFKFLVAYVDYSIFKIQRDYMDRLILTGEGPSRINDLNCDLWYKYDIQIKNDSLGYYNHLISKGVFYNRPKNDESLCEITDLEIMQLKSIKEIFDRHNTSYKIVISPMYDMINLENEQIELLYDIFGKKNVFDFSGNNKFTSPISNYYEADHFRPHVANEILDIIYSN